jgi:hypothetical protein
MSSNQTIRKHCQATYSAFQENAVLGEDGKLVWIGKTTDLFKELAIPSGYYGRVMRQLEFMGCVTRRHRGSLGTPSEVELHRDPSSIKEWQDEPQKGLTKPEDFATLSQRVTNLETLVGGLHIGEALRALTEDIAQVRRSQQ